VLFDFGIQRDILGDHLLLTGEWGEGGGGEHIDGKTLTHEFSFPIKYHEKFYCVCPKNAQCVLTIICILLTVRYK